MCGFVFAYSQTGDRLPDQTRLDRMDGAIRHRGPDEHGQMRCDRAVMGHRRLAIIDLAGGQQPMRTLDGQVWIVFNGEIYNFHAVRDELAAAGHALSTHFDTEVLPHAYLVWREKCLDRLNGMFAFALPRFVPRENYASYFGLEWNIHGRTQYDETSGSSLSRERRG